MSRSIDSGVVPVEPRFVPRFVAEPPQEPLPYGRWAATLQRHFLGAVDAIDPGEEDLGEPGEVAEPLYERFRARLDGRGGVFGAHMEVELVNDGPVTVILEV